MVGGSGAAGVRGTSRTRGLKPCAGRRRALHQLGTGSQGVWGTLKQDQGAECWRVFRGARDNLESLTVRAAWGIRVLWSRAGAQVLGDTDGDRRVGCSTVAGTGYLGSLSCLRLSSVGVGCWLLQCSRAGWAGEAGLLQMPLCIILHGNPSWQDIWGQGGTPPTYTGNCTSLRCSTYPELNEFRPCMWTIPFPLTDPQHGLSVAREMHPFTTESYSKKALAWQVPRKTAEIWQLWSLVDQTLYTDDAHSPRAHLCVPRNNPNPRTHWKSCSGREITSRMSVQVKPVPH